jgi:hypothetical protein
VPGGDVEEGMPAGVELGGVDPPAAAVVDDVDGRVLVGGEPELDGVRLAAELAEPASRQTASASAGSDRKMSPPARAGGTLPGRPS